MLTLYDYRPSQNAWKVRLLLNHLARPYETVEVSIFEGAGQAPAYRAVNPTGAVPALRLDDGRVLAESLAILCYLAEGTPYLPADAYERAKVLQWLSLENDYLQNSIGSLRFWKLTGKRRPPELVEGKTQIALRCLRILDDALAGADFLVGGGRRVQRHAAGQQQRQQPGRGFHLPPGRGSPGASYSRRPEPYTRPAARAPFVNNAVQSGSKWNAFRNSPNFRSGRARRMAATCARASSRRPASASVHAAIA